MASDAASDGKRTALVVYYSETGHTHDAAEALDHALAKDFVATVERLAAPGLDGRTGFWAFCWRALTALAGRGATIAPPQHDPAGFDLVVLAAPVWAGRLATPMRGYLERFGKRIRHAAYVTTNSGDNAERALADFATLVGRPGVATLALSDADRRDHHDARKLAEFAAVLAAAPTD